MSGLISVNGWFSPMASNIGRYKNEDGQPLSGFYRIDHRKTSDMLVLEDGHCRGTYTYPRVEIPFRHPMVSWLNLAFCGGYSIPKPDGTKLGDEDIINAVIAGTKPIGFVVGSKSKIEEYAKLVEKTGLPYCINDTHRTNFFGQKYYELGIANNGTLGDDFDLEALIQSYRVLSEAYGTKYTALSENDEIALRRLSNKKLESFLKGYDYAKISQSNSELVITGLILGYAVESTFACITERVR